MSGVEQEHVAQAVVPPLVDEAAAVTQRLREAVALFEGIDDQVARLAAESLRSTVDAPPDTRPVELVVVGETKAGKSTLINALLGRPGLAPVDVDVATNARLVFHYDSTERAQVFLQTKDKPVDIPPSGDELLEWATERGNAGNQRGVLQVEIGLAHRLLQAGLILVDTPGVLGIDIDHNRVTLEALRFARAMLFVIRSDRVIGKPELAFLERARDNVGNILFAVTKVDLNETGWREVADENLRVLSQIGLGSRPLFPLRSIDKEKADLALLEGDHRRAVRLAERSGYQELEAHLRRVVIGRKRLGDLLNAVQAARPAVSAIVQSAQRISVDDSDSDVREQHAQAQQAFTDFRAVASGWLDAFRRDFDDLSRDVVVWAETDIGVIASTLGLDRADREQLSGIEAQVKGSLEAVFVKTMARILDEVDAICARATGTLELPAFYWSVDAPALAAAMTASKTVKADAAFNRSAFRAAVEQDWQKLAIGGGSGVGFASAFLGASLFGVATGGVGVIAGLGAAAVLIARQAPLHALRREYDTKLKEDIAAYRRMASVDLPRRVKEARRVAEEQISGAVTHRLSTLQEAHELLFKKLSANEAERTAIRDQAGKREESAARADEILDNVEQDVVAMIGGDPER